MSLQYVITYLNGVYILPPDLFLCNLESGSLTKDFPSDSLDLHQSTFRANRGWKSDVCVRLLVVDFSSAFTTDFNMRPTGQLNLL